jgi:aspartate racemase
MGEHMHPEISMHTHPLREYMIHVKNDDWKMVADLMLSSARKLANIGAEFIICPDNTIHEAFDIVKDASPVPWLHIAEEVARTAKINGCNCLAITGTKYLMNGPVYQQALDKYGIECKIPDQDDCEQIDSIIFDQLVNGVFSEKSRLYFNKIYEKMKSRGCDAAVMGCTEIPLLVDPNDCPLAVLDSTRVLARAALKYSLEKD